MLRWGCQGLLELLGVDRSCQGLIGILGFVSGFYSLVSY